MKLLQLYATKPQLTTGKTMRQSQPHNWNIGSIEEVSQNRLFRATKAQVRNPRNGVEKEFFRLEMPPWVNILALTPENKVLLVRQFRFGTERLEWEIPGGVVESGESPLDAGIRELKEESGFAGDTAKVLGTLSPNPAIQSNTLTMVLVENAVPVAEQQLDPMEDIEVRLVDIDEMITMIKEKEIRHSFTCNALFHYFLLTGRRC